MNKGTKDNFWAAVGHQLEELETAKSAADVIRILPPSPGLSSADGFFGGSGGDGSVWESLRAAGWRQVWAEAAYFYAMRSPDGSMITYIEGDIYRGDRH